MNDNVIRLVPDAKKEKKIKTIEFLNKLIKSFEDDDLDPEKCVVLCKWTSGGETDAFQYYTNGVNTETFLSLTKLCDDKYLKDVIHD